MTIYSVEDQLRPAIIALHTSKDAAYRDAWKKRGEVLGVVANIARKADRLENALDGAPDTPDETHLDTAIDLFVYAVKYRTFLADLDPALDEALFPGQQEGRGGRSDGPTFVNQLLGTYPAASDTPALAAIGPEVIAIFNRLVGAVTDGVWEPVDMRYRLATELAAASWLLVQAYAEASPRATTRLLETVAPDAG